MNYVVVGVNHKTAPIALREKLALTADKLDSVLDQVRNYPSVTEAAVLSTCNRVEIYGVTGNAKVTESALADYFCDTLSESNLDSILYSKTNAAAVAHLFSVTASLDSLVVGENQIAGQVKAAYQMAAEHAATGPYLNKLFNRALFVAKRIKTETDVGRGNVSVGSVGVKLAKKIFGTLTDRKIVLVGAGEIGELVLRHLHAGGPSGETVILNRSFDKALNLQEQGYGKAEPWENLKSCLLQSDILITSVSTQLQDLNEDHFATLMQQRKNQPLFIIDLGVPRNIDKSVGEITNVYLYNVDDLISVATENKNHRSGELGVAQNIIDEEARLFYDTYLGDPALPTIVGLNKKFDEVRRQELNKTLAKMAHLSAEDQEHIAKLTRSIIAKVLHEPMLQLKDKRVVQSSPVLAVLKKIFSLDDEGDDES